MMFFVLGLIRTLTSIRRRLFGHELPHWLKDVIGVAGYFDVITFIPTFLAIALGSRHFFRRVPIILKSKHPLYMTPLKFVTTGCAWIVALGYLVAKYGGIELPWTRNQAFMAVAAIIFTTPIWVFAVCLLNRLVFGMLLAFGTILSWILERGATVL